MIDVLRGQYQRLSDSASFDYLDVETRDGSASVVFSEYMTYDILGKVIIY